MNRNKLDLIDICLSKISLLVLENLLNQTEEITSTSNEVVHVDFNFRKRPIDEVDNGTRTKRIKLLDQSIGSEAAKQVDSNEDRYVNSVDPGLALKLYLSCLPGHLWTKLLKRFLHGIRSDMPISKYKVRLLAKKMCEVLFSLRVKEFSTAWIAQSVFRDVEDIIFENIFICRRILKLEVANVLCESRSQKMLYCSLLSMKNLRSLLLLPSEMYSFHWMLPIFQTELPHLEELRIVYDNSSDTLNIRSLAGCPKLTKLYLYSYGCKSEAYSISFLLQHLKNLEVLFHKEVPNALLQYREEHSEPLLNLCNLILFDWIKSIGMQTIYIPNEFLEKICQLCPNLKQMSLINPSCLNKVAQTLPKLTSLSIQQGNFSEIIGKGIVSNTFENLRSLELKYLMFITYADIFNLAKHCTFLQHLKIIGCNVVASGELSLHGINNAYFRNLKSLTVRRVSQTRNAFEPDQWHVGRRISEFLLKNGSRLEYLELEFGSHPYVSNFNWNNFEHLFADCINLEELYLTSPPVISYNIVKNIVTYCSQLKSFGHSETWNLAVEEKCKILESFNRIIV